MAGHATLRSATLADLVKPGTVRPASEPDPFGSDRLLPVLPELSELLPGRGLRRGSTVAVVAGPPVETDSRTPLDSGTPSVNRGQRGGQAKPGGARESGGASEPAGMSEPDGMSEPGGMRERKGQLEPGGRGQRIGRAQPGGWGEKRAEVAGRAQAGGAVSAASAGDAAEAGVAKTSGDAAEAGTGRTSGDWVEAGGAGASGSASLVLALIAAASRSGSWCALVGIPTFGALAAADMGIALDRLALVPNPGPDWPTVVAALIDGVDVVVIAAPSTASASIVSRLAARARQRGTVLVPYGRWAGADVTLRVVRGEWEGLGQGRGRVRRRQVVIAARGRGAASRPKEITVWMPADDGRTVAAVVEAAPRRRARLTVIRPAS